uniref:PDZ domain-containing protein n=1 Tax=Lepisosteus oculatus TaxID=7918 RepID=W5NGA0_LEPOC
AKALGELNTEETCWWFTKLGLQKYIPFIRGANLRGSHIASIDLEILDLLHVSTPEERECLLSAVYRELHPPDTTTQELDTLLGRKTIGSYNVEKFTAALVNLKEISSKVENREQADPSHSVCNQNQQMDLENKEDKRRDLSQQVDRLQKVIYQVQGLHQSLASFCAELRDTDAEADVEGMCLGDTVVGLQQTERKRTEKELLVGGLRQRLSSLRAHTSGQRQKYESPIEVHLFDKMKLDCQIFMEEINIIFLNQQMARLKSAHQICKVKARDNMTSCTLGQLLSHQPPAVLLAIQETATAGTYGFRVQLKEGSGLVVVDVGNSKLCVNDRLVEVNGVSVVDYREEELKPLLSCQSCLIVVLRRP